MSKLLVLGAGAFQVSGIKKAMALGHEVITVDNMADSIGHRFSSGRAHCSTTDPAGILKIADELSVDGVCTFASDVAVDAVAHASTELGLAGVPHRSAQIMSFKHRFRSFQRDSGLPHPQFAHGKSIEELGDLTAFTWPLVFKPADTSGSRGVVKLSLSDQRSVAEAFSTARTFSRTGTVCVEEFVDGTEVGGDAIVIGGKVAFVAITRKYLSGFVVTGHSLPAQIDADAEAAVICALEDCCAALGNITSVVNFDVMLRQTDTCVLEMSPRTGGNGIPAVIAYATGVDPEIATIQLALGQAPETEPTHPMRGSGSWVFGSQKPGVLHRMNDIHAVRRVVPELLDLHQTTQLGDAVRPFNHGGNLLGYALFRCQVPGEYASIVERLERALKLEVRSP